MRSDRTLIYSLSSRVSRNVISHTQAAMGKYTLHQEGVVGIAKALKGSIISSRKYIEIERKGAKNLTEDFWIFVHK